MADVAVGAAGITVTVKATSPPPGGSLSVSGLSDIVYPVVGGVAQSVTRNFTITSDVVCLDHLRAVGPLAFRWTTVFREPGRLFWVCPGSFPGGDMMMAHSRGVSWV